MEYTRRVGTAHQEYGASRMHLLSERRLDPGDKGDSDLYLDKDGNACADGSGPSHLYP